MMRLRLLALATLLLAARVDAAVTFVRGSSENAENTSQAALTAAPITLACWVKTDNNTDGQTALTLGQKTDTVNFFALNANGNIAGDPIRAQASGGSAGPADTTSGYSINTWTHAAAVFTSTTSRAALINAASKGTSATSITPSGIISTAIGSLSLSTNGNYWSGTLAECGMWNAALTDAEIGMLANGFAPPCVRPSKLVSYYPMIRPQSGALRDYYKSRITLTLTGGAAATHPLIRYCQ